MTTRYCQDCGEPVEYRRYRCALCGLLVCAWCIGHVHRYKQPARKGQR